MGSTVFETPHSVETSYPGMIPGQRPLGETAPGKEGPGAGVLFSNETGPLFLEGQSVEGDQNQFLTPHMKQLLNLGTTTPFSVKTSEGTENTGQVVKGVGDALQEDTGTGGGDTNSDTSDSSDQKSTGALRGTTGTSQTPPTSSLDSLPAMEASLFDTVLLNILASDVNKLRSDEIDMVLQKVIETLEKLTSSSYYAGIQSQINKELLLQNLKRDFMKKAQRKIKTAKKRQKAGFFGSRALNIGMQVLAIVVTVIVTIAMIAAVVGTVGLATAAILPVTLLLLGGAMGVGMSVSGMMSAIGGEASEADFMSKLMKQLPEKDNMAWTISVTVAFALVSLSLSLGGGFAASSAMSAASNAANASNAASASAASNNLLTRMLDTINKVSFLKFVMMKVLPGVQTNFQMLMAFAKSIANVQSALQGKAAKRFESKAVDVEAILESVDRAFDMLSQTLDVSIKTKNEAKDSMNVMLVEETEVSIKLARRRA